MAQLTKDIQNDKIRMTNMQEHLNNLKGELSSQQYLTNAKGKEVEAEIHLKQLTVRETKRLVEETQKFDQQNDEVKNRVIFPP